MAIRFEEKGKEGAEPSRRAKPAKASAVPDAGGEPKAAAEDLALPFAKPVKPDKKGQRPKR